MPYALLFLYFFFFGIDGHDDVFRACADAELAAPDAHAAADVIGGVAPFVIAEGALVDALGDPRDGPYLSVMGVSAELEVDVLSLSLFQMVGLMVQEDAVFAEVGLLHDDTQRIAVYVGAVVASDDAEVADYFARVLQQMDAGLLIELLGFGLTAIELVVAQTGIDRGVDTLKLLVHLLFDERTHAAIDDVAGYQHQVGMLSVNQVYPSGELAAAVMVAYVHVAQHDYLDGSLQPLLGGQMYLLTILLLIVQIAIEKDDEHEAEYTARSQPVVVEVGARNEPKEAAKVEHQECHEQIEQDEDAGRAHLVDTRGKSHRHAVGRAEDACKHQQKRCNHQQDDEQFPWPRQG